jgi:hypothetical protein
MSSLENGISGVLTYLDSKLQFLNRPIVSIVLCVILIVLMGIRIDKMMSAEAVGYFKNIIVKVSVFVAIAYLTRINITLSILLTLFIIMMMMANYKASQEFYDNTIADQSASIDDHYWLNDKINNDMSEQYPISDPNSVYVVSEELSDPNVPLENLNMARDTEDLENKGNMPEHSLLLGADELMCNAPHSFNAKA